MRSRVFMLWLVAAWIACLALFLLDPAIDLTVSRYFYDPLQHRFPFGLSPAMRWFTHSIYWLSDLLTAMLVAVLLAHGCRRRWCGGLRRLLPLSGMRMLYLVAVLALGPGLAVNYLCKDFLGRPRPMATVAFGGDQAFVPVAQVGHGMGQSFVSGHAAIGFYFASFAYVLPRRRRTIYASGVLAGTLLGLCRIVAGRHYLSDVLFSGLITLTVAHLCWLYLRSWVRVHDQRRHLADHG